MLFAVSLGLMYLQHQFAVAVVQCQAEGWLSWEPGLPETTEAGQRLPAGNQQDSHPALRKVGDLWCAVPVKNVRP